MKEPVYRPPSVWITQALLLSYLVIKLLPLPVALFLCFSSKLIPSCLSTQSIVPLVGVFLGLSLIFLIFWGLQKRKHYGKWLAVSLLIGLMIPMISEGHLLRLVGRSIIQWRPLPTPPYLCWEPLDPLDGNSQDSCGYSSYLGLAVLITSDVLPAMLFGWLAARLLFSNAAKRFFQ